jgi:hypothetical protein
MSQTGTEKPESSAAESYAEKLFIEANALESALNAEDSATKANSILEKGYARINQLNEVLYSDTIISDNDRIECLRELGFALQRITQSKKNASEATLRARKLRDIANKLTAQRIAAHENNQLSGRGEIYVFDNE